MHLHVSGDPRLAEALPTDGAQVGGAFMQPLVLLQRVAAQEALVALAAGKDPPLPVEPLVLVVPRGADEALLTLDAAVRKAVELHVGLQLIGKFKDLFTLQALGFLLGELLVDGSGA